MTIDLLVRGLCCLKPGVEKISENIRVHTVIDRFLEHARIFQFANGGNSEVFCASADWMPRNFRRRVEVMFPILDPSLKQRVSEEILATMRADTVKGWLLDATGRYRRTKPTKAGSLRSQTHFMELARERSKEVDFLRKKQLSKATSPRDKLRAKTKRNARKGRRKNKG